LKHVIHRSEATRVFNGLARFLPMYWLIKIKFDQQIPHEHFFATFTQNAIFLTPFRITKYYNDYLNQGGILDVHEMYQLQEKNLKLESICSRYGMLSDSKDFNTAQKHPAQHGIAV
jgi:hypothetical protein